MILLFNLENNKIVFRYIYFFFLKKKTAYEMHISDWSSEVCSSDLIVCNPIERRPDDDVPTRSLQRHLREDADNDQPGRSIVFAVAVFVEYAEPRVAVPRVSTRFPRF